MNLYSIHSEVADFNLNLYVIADTAEVAHALWERHIRKEGWYTGRSLPPSRVFHITPVSVDGPARSLDWHQSHGVLEIEV